MEHINFIETKSKVLFENRRPELDYFVMILIAGAVFAVVLASHMILGDFLLSYQHELVLLHQSTESKPGEVVETPVVGIAWSEWLKKYSAEFPKNIRLTKIQGTFREGRKIVMEAMGEKVSDIGRAKKALVRSSLCARVELGKITPSEEGVLFELECL